MNYNKHESITDIFSIALIQLVSLDGKHEISY